jgi:hypothetical protein
MAKKARKQTKQQGENSQSELVSKLVQVSVASSKSVTYLGKTPGTFFNCRLAFPINQQLGDQCCHAVSEIRF